MGNRKAREEVVNLQQILGERRSVALSERASPFDPSEYYQTRQGLCVWPDFRGRFFAAAKKIEKAPAIEIVFSDLVKDADDATIRVVLPENHLFDDLSLFLAHLATMIERQPAGEDGDLLTNGCANIFYVVVVDGGVFAVRVYWDFIHREWMVRAYSLLEDRWDARGRVFFRN